MKKQKYKYIRLFTFLGLIAVLSLQTVWIYNTYMLIRYNIQKDCCEVLEEAIENEMKIRMACTPEGTQVIGGEVNGTINPLTYFCENLSNMGYKMSLLKVDSIASALLKEYSIESNFVVCTMNPQNDSILQVSKKEKLPLWGIIKSAPFAIKSDSTEAVQLVLVNPYKVFFERMGLLMIASFIMLVLVIGCIIYQIKVIIYQKKVAKLREDFSYAMIHDMKTPLSSIMMCSDALNDEKIESMPELKKSFLGVVKSETVHLLKLINRLLTISRLESHKLTMFKEKVQLEPMLERIMETFKAKSTKPLHFTLNLQAKEVNADKEYLEEAVYNLVDNAVKYSKDEGGRAEPFRRAVWEILLTIPFGQTMTYGEIADTMAMRRGSAPQEAASRKEPAKMSAQAVGGAVGHNAISLIIPCHRVVGTSGSLTGYAGGIEKKLRLLTMEKADISSLFMPKRGTAL